MNTPAHLLLGAAILARPHRRGSLTAALAGSLAPDLSLYLMVGWHLGVVGTPAEIIFRDLYFSERWQTVFAVDNSIFLWLGIFALGVHLARPWLRTFAATALLHIAFDFPFHAGDGRPHFWPLSRWVFDSPISYWDNAHFGWLLGPAELALAGVLLILLIRRFRSASYRALFALLFAMEAGSSGVWHLVF
ncbi:MAG: cobalamin biosynthesis protein CobQ [Pseudomonadota bacterium]